MLETVSGSIMFAALGYFLWTALLNVPRLRRRRDARMQKAFFTPPTRQEVDAAMRWLRRELEVGA